MATERVILFLFCSLWRHGDLLGIGIDADTANFIDNQQVVASLRRSLRIGESTRLPNVGDAKRRRVDNALAAYNGGFEALCRNLQTAIDTSLMARQRLCWCHELYGSYRLHVNAKSLCSGKEHAVHIDPNLISAAKG